jgi:hypothetical protein
VRFVLAAMPFAAGIAVANRWLWGGWLSTGYSVLGERHTGVNLNALFGLLFGWWRGLFVYSPVLVLGAVGFAAALTRARGFVERRLIALGLAAIATILFYSGWDQWWGGLHQFGYRFLLDITPFLVIMGAYAVDRLRLLRRPAIVLAFVSVLTMTFGAAPNRFSFDGIVFARTPGEASLGQAWIVFGHSPLRSLARLAGVGVVAAIAFWAAGRRSNERMAEADP